MHKEDRETDASRVYAAGCRWELKTSCRELLYGTRNLFPCRRSPCRRECAIRSILAEVRAVCGFSAQPSQFHWCFLPPPQPVFRHQHLAAQFLKSPGNPIRTEDPSSIRAGGLRSILPVSQGVCRATRGSLANRRLLYSPKENALFRSAISANTMPGHSRPAGSPASGMPVAAP